MNRIFLIAFAASLALSGTSTRAQLEPEALQRKREEQQRAKAMTRDLLSGVLNLQLRQLEENDLTDLEVYRDIELMRENLSDIVDAEMTKVVELLAGAQGKSKENREAAFVEARRMIRTIVLKLSAERQSLLRRLKIAELTEQTRRLIALQMRVQTATREVSEESAERQESLTLKAVEDQRDVKELFLVLLEAMNDVRTWGGALSNAAADGLKLLKAAGVGKDLDDAGRTLAATEYSASVDHQEAVLKGLRDLLKLLQRTQGVLGAANQSSLTQLQEIARQQQALRDETRKLDPNRKAPEALVERQAKIQQALSKLEEAVRQHPDAEQHLDEAKAAAREATAELFENHRDEAVAEQTKVLGHLAAVEEALKSDSPNAVADQSAAELAQMVRDLERRSNRSPRLRRNKPPPRNRPRRTPRPLRNRKRTWPPQSLRR